MKQQQHKENVYYHLEDVKHQLQLIQKDIEGQLLELHTAERAETAATSAVRQLETHVGHWRTSAQVIQNMLMCCTGYLNMQRNFILLFIILFK